MKRIVPLFLAAALLLTACFDTQSSNESLTTQSDKNTTQSSADSKDGTSSDETSSYDPFARADNDENTSATAASYSCGVNWKEGKDYVLDYAPTVSFEYFVKNDSADTDFGLMLFVNGIRQPYRTDTDTEDKVMHIFDVNKDETKTQTISFEAVTGEQGDELSVEIITMLHPDFVQETSSNYGFNHKITSFYASKLSVTEKTGKIEPKICTSYETTPITDELRRQFDTTDEKGLVSENMLDNTVYVDVLKNGVLCTPEDLRIKEQDITPFKTSDYAELCMYGGKPCQYRVSMYVNHELIKGAFDGMDYIDINVSKDNICKKKIEFQNLNLSLNDYNNLYFVAVPSYTDYSVEERMVLKSASVTVVK